MKTLLTVLLMALTVASFAQKGSGQPTLHVYIQNVNDKEIKAKGLDLEITDAYIAATTLLHESGSVELYFQAFASLDAYAANEPFTSELNLNTCTVQVEDIASKSVSDFKEFARQCFEERGYKVEVYSK